MSKEEDFRLRMKHVCLGVMGQSRYSGHCEGRYAWSTDVAAN